MARIPVAISGSGGHDQTFNVAVALLHGFALPEAEAWPILTEYGARCSPPWSIVELRHKLASAGKLSRHSKPRGHLLENGRGALVIVRKQQAAQPAARRAIGRVQIRRDLPAAVVAAPIAPAIEEVAAQTEAETLPPQSPEELAHAHARRYGQVIPAQCCPICWVHWGRYLVRGCCVCTGSIMGYSTYQSQ